jgi:hypothetical protein
MTSILLAALLALCAASASAQMIYTSVGLDGQKSFSDRAAAPAEPALEAAPLADEPKAARRRNVVPARLSATVNAHEAERRLAQAQRKRSQGMAPQAGESVRIPGGVEVNARYWHRQEKARIEVEQAQRRLNHVQRPMLARQ